jgi:hypothetical protein
MYLPDPLHDGDFFFFLLIGKLFEIVYSVHLRIRSRGGAARESYYP